MDSIPSVSITELNGQTSIEICQILQGMQNRISIPVQDFRNIMFILKSIDERMRSKVESDKTLERISNEDESKPSVGTKRSKNVEYNPESKEVKSDYENVKSIRDDLLDIYCDQFCERIPNKLLKRCTGCLFGSDARLDHDVCKLLKRKEKIELVFDEIMSELDDSTLKSLLTEKRWNGVLPYNENMYIEKNIIVKNSRWMRMLKNKINEMI